MDNETVLANCRLFSRVEGASRARLVAMTVEKRYARGETIFRRGDGCPGVFIVGSGLVRVFLISPAGKQQVLHLAVPGQTFAEVAAIGAFPCPASAEAVTDTTCLLLPMTAFQHALRNDHTLCLQLLSSFAFWVRHFMGLVEDITLRDAAGRIARFLLAHTGDRREVVRLPSLKKDLASQFNLTSETLSRTLRRLHDAGLITSSEGHEVHILDAEGLRRVRDGLEPEI